MKLFDLWVHTYVACTTQTLTDRPTDQPTDHLIALLRRCNSGYHMFKLTDVCFFVVKLMTFSFSCFFFSSLSLSLNHFSRRSVVCIVATIACYSQSAIICSNHEFRDAVVRLLSLMKYDGLRDYI